jgi:hypothetical protein
MTYTSDVLDPDVIYRVHNPYLQNSFPSHIPFHPKPHHSQLLPPPCPLERLLLSSAPLLSLLECRCTCSRSQRIRNRPRSKLSHLSLSCYLSDYHLARISKKCFGDEFSWRDSLLYIVAFLVFCLKSGSLTLLRCCTGKFDLRVIGGVDKDSFSPGCVFDSN